jgi:DNA-binding response OmpR family regulator
MTFTDDSIVASKVLVLEKDDSLREATRMLLEADGYGVITAASLPAALDAAREDPGIEILLVDHHPADGVIGTQAIRALREVIGLRLKTLLLTDHIYPSLRELEHDDHVRVATSPIGADALVAKLQALRAM